MLTLPNKIEKLQVHAYKKSKRSGKAKKFSFLINPATVNVKHKNKFHHSSGMNTSGRSSTYSYSGPDEMSLELTVDNTLKREELPGVPETEKLSVRKKMELFLEYCFYMDGDIHEPRFLVVKWGEISFECRLKSIKVNYTHFNEKGDPLRAKLDTVFVADMPDEKRIRLENKKSPDITHRRTILQGDTLTGLTKEIYGDASHYLFVAAFNQLDNIRNLTPGAQLHFPPLEK